MTTPLGEQFPNGSIICLESQDEEYYSWSLHTWIDATIESDDEVSKAAICTLWDGEEWDSIVEKANVEGSTWYVWWMDGVRTYKRLDQEGSNSSGEPPST